MYFSGNDIWVTDYCSPIHWDGSSWTLYHLQNMGLDVCAGTAMWGTSSSNMYFVGVNGGIVHYDGVEFTKMESGTDVDLKNIAGTPDGEHVFAVGNSNSTGHAIVLEKNGGSWTTFYYNESVIPGGDNYGTVYRGMAVFEDTSYFATGKGLWKYNFNSGGFRLLEGRDFYSLLQYGAVGIAVHSLNDILIGTFWARVIHFNGSTWVLDNTVLDQYGPGQIVCEAMDSKNSTIVMVGYVKGGMHAFVAIGTRN